MRATRRVPIVLAAVVAAVWAGLSGCGMLSSSPAPELAAPVAVELPELQGIGLRQVWQRQVRLEPGERIKKTWRVGASLYVATTDTRFMRIEAKNGVLMWSNVLGRENFDIYQPIELNGPEGKPNGEVLVVTRGTAFAFNMDTGDQLRTARLGLSVAADPVVIGNTLCVGSADTFYGLYLDRMGTKHWRVPVPGDLFVTAPLAQDQNVFVGSRNGLLWRISADTGNWEWKDRKTNGLILGGMGADYSAVYVPCDDQRVYAFHTDTGGELWERQLDGRLEEAPVLGGPVVMVTSVNRRMSALLRLTGEVKWAKEGVAQVATIGDETVWIGDTSGQLRQVALETGDERATVQTTGIQFFVRNTTDKNVILVTHAGLVGMYAPTSAAAPAGGN